MLAYGITTSMTMKGKSTIERFIEKIDKEGSCWNWNSAMTSTGYGQFHTYENGRDNPTMHTAHRFAWELMRGPIPEGMLLCHTCDNRRCVNPSHIFLGTAKDNTQDMIKKRRGLQCQPKLSFEQAKDIRKLYAEGKYSYSQLAKLYGVSTTPIQNIIRYHIHKPNSTP